MVTGTVGGTTTTGTIGAAAERNPTSEVAKRFTLGRTSASSDVPAPIHLAIVEAYWSTAVVGMSRPAPTSSAVFTPMAGGLPYTLPPFTRPPITRWCEPHA